MHSCVISTVLHESFTMAEYCGYSFMECADMICVYARMDYNSRAARRNYEELYPNRRIPTTKMFVSLLQRLRDTGSVVPKKIDTGVQRTSRTVEMEEEILDRITENPQTSTRAIAASLNESPTIVLRVLHGEGLYPFHIQRVQELNPTDFEPRIAYCRWFLEYFRNEPHFARRILFTDEATFTREGIWNCHNNHVWQETNPHAIRPHAHQRKFSVNVWAGILDGQLIGPYLLPSTLTGASYLDFLRTTLPKLLEDIPLYTRQHMWFQHDGAPSHFSYNVRAHLNATFGNRWIGRSGPVAWPARSPDLTPLDFSVWGILKEMVYKTPVESAEDLVGRISVAANEFSAIPGIFDNIYDSIAKRCTICINIGGQQFEQCLHRHI